MKLRKITYIIVFLLAAVNLQAQQAPLYSQYVLNSFLINPAIAGSEGYGTLNLTAREQWVGIKDSPSTYALSFHSLIKPTSHIKKTPKLKVKEKRGFSNGKVGIGAYVFNDRNGALGRTGLRISYAYHLYNKMDGSQLSFGLSLAGYQMKFNDDRVSLRDEDDEVWYSAREPIYIPDADMGVYYTRENLFVGLSVDQLLESLIKFGSNSFDQYKLERNYYLFGGYDFQLSDRLVLTPSTLLKVSENGAFQGDITAKLFFDQSFWGGLTYRTGNAVIIMAGLSLDRYVFGYAFDASLSSIMKHSYGSHEFMFAYKLGDYTRGYRWLNR